VKKLLLWAIAASLLVAVIVYMVSATRTPTYEASALLMVDQKEQSYGKIHPIPNAPLGVYAHQMIIAIETRPVAEGAIRRLGVGGSLSPGELLDNLTVEQVESSRFIRLTYTDPDPERAWLVPNAFGREASERVSVGSAANSMTPTLFNKAGLPDAPASPKPLRNGLFALVAGLAISSAVLFAARRGWLRLDWPG
jgi:capsular polysaccharide biosynthesis protein